MRQGTARRLATTERKAGGEEADVIIVDWEERPRPPGPGVRVIEWDENRPKPGDPDDIGDVDFSDLWGDDGLAELEE